MDSAAQGQPRRDIPLTLIGCFLYRVEAVDVAVVLPRLHLIVHVAELPDAHGVRRLDGHVMRTVLTLFFVRDTNGSRCLFQILDLRQHQFVVFLTLIACCLIAH